MSCNNFHNERKNINFDNVIPYDDKSNFATFETNYNPPTNAPGTKIVNSTTSINDDFIISQQSEEKINNNVDKIVNSIYDNEMISPNLPVNKFHNVNPVYAPNIIIHKVPKNSQMGTCKFFMLLIFIIILGYGLFQLYKRSG